MDELLKAYAEKRRQDPGGSVELHPVTRQMLQGEVARIYGKPRATPWLSRLLAYWPRMAFAAACLAITFTLMLVVLPRRTMESMSQTEMAAASSDSRTVADKEKSVLLEDLANSPAPPTSTAPAMPAPDLKRLDALAKNEVDEARAMALAEPVRREKADAAKLMSEQAPKDVQLRSYYINTPDAGRTRYMQRKQETQLGARLETVPQVLDSFDFEQEGRNIRITDRDGSVYAGNVLSEQELKKQAAVAGGAAAVAGQTVAGPATDQPVFFRAAGTNRSLRQLVSIEANISQVQTNVLPAIAPAQEVNQRAPAKPQQQQLIRGRATIGKSQELQIEAVPAQQQQP